MSFGAGMGAGMGAGIGAGIAIGMSTGQKKTQDQIREYFVAHGMTVRDGDGDVVPLETVLTRAVAEDQCGSRRWVPAVLAITLLTGVAVLGTIVYFAVL